MCKFMWRRGNEGGGQREGRIKGEMERRGHWMKDMETKTKQRENDLQKWEACRRITVKENTWKVWRQKRVRGWGSQEGKETSRTRRDDGEGPCEKKWKQVRGDKWEKEKATKKEEEEVKNNEEWNSSRGEDNKWGEKERRLVGQDGRKGHWLSSTEQHLWKQSLMTSNHFISLCVRQTRGGVCGAINAAASAVNVQQETWLFLPPRLGSTVVFIYTSKRDDAKTIAEQMELQHTSLTLRRKWTPRFCLNSSLTAGLLPWHTNQKKKKK